MFAPDGLQVPYPRDRRAPQEGVALVTVLIVAAIVMLLVITTISLVTRDARVTRNDTAATRLTLLADGASDVARMTLLRSYQDSKLSTKAWLDAVAPCRTSAGCVPLSGTVIPEVQALVGKHATAVAGSTLTWAVKEVSGSGLRTWVRLAATATDANGGQQTVIRRVEFGSSSIFDLAMLSDTTNCMFCHLTVNGDVGATAFFRPGWGNEGGHELSGRGSTVNGSIFAAKDVTADGTLNGLVATGTTTTQYSGPKLPDDTTGDGVPDFPGLDAALARKSADGTVSGGSIQGVPIGGNYGSGAVALASVGPVYDGNLVLTGTQSNPIRLDKDLYVTGDVVLKGFVTGRGAVYAGRNMYVAGNLENVNKASKPGAGNCAGISDADACARANIAAGTDETRLAATNNIVLGDYTEQNDQGGSLSLDRLQASDYIRTQFGLWNGSNTARYVRKGTSEELKADGSGFIDSMGRPVSPGEVVTYGVNGSPEADPYVPIIKPGVTSAAGAFKPWMTDAQYRDLLGTETRSAYTWRHPFDTATLTEDQIAAQLYDAGLPLDTAKTVAPLIKAGNVSKNLSYNGVNKDGRTVSGPLNVSGTMLRAGVDQPGDYATETSRLDAFLYANSRVAGKLSPRGGHVNGGIIAREIGILAPGKNSAENWWRQGINTTATQAAFQSYSTCDPTADVAALNTTEDANFNASTKSCDFTVNYDYRLRNGGFGFHLIRNTGATSEWKLDTQGTEAVQP